MINFESTYFLYAINHSSLALRITVLSFFCVPTDVCVYSLGLISPNLVIYFFNIAIDFRLIYFAFFLSAKKLTFCQSFLASHVSITALSSSFTFLNVRKSSVLSILKIKYLLIALLYKTFFLIISKSSACASIQYEYTYALSFQALLLKL